MLHGCTLHVGRAETWHECFDLTGRDSSHHSLEDSSHGAELVSILPCCVANFSRWALKTHMWLYHPADV